MSPAQKISLLINIFVVIKLILGDGSSNSDHRHHPHHNHGSLLEFPRARTMFRWRYRKTPRYEALVIKLQSKAIHPGEMSCWKNLVTVTDFTSSFLIYFPTARKGSTYSIIIYSDTEVIFVKYKIEASVIFRGMNGPDSSGKNLFLNLVSFVKVYATIFEDDPRKIGKLDPASLKVGIGSQALEIIRSHTLGMAGTVCLTVLADKFKIQPKPRTVEHNFKKNIDPNPKGW